MLLYKPKELTKINSLAHTTVHAVFLTVTNWFQL